ncbi:YdbH domain-containing protein [Nitrosomonas communis]|uniref:intermembrane phospholipid transport protein YdbH family protein n=1 Tax=Nitrosomonas communis TaxID=44574 RepID=UPI0026EAC834|nr:YdbH domain-containing protein [Nitrosomonas communis]MCO6426928.1 YdbH domain-containing protein [Nitrosomonas communis]
MSKPNKHLANWLLTLTSLAIITGMGLYLFRAPLLASLISYQLREQNIPLQSLSVVEISLDGLLLHDLTIGTANELHVDTIHVSWHLRDLLAGMIGSVQVSGLQIALDLSGERPPLGSLQPLLSANGGNSHAIILPAIALRDSAIHARSAWGDIVIALAGDIEQARSGMLSARLITEIASPAGRTRSTLTATMDHDGSLQGKITVSEGVLSLPETQISSLTGEAAFTLTGMHPQLINAEFMLADIHLSATGQTAQVFEQASISLQIDATDARLTGELLAADDALVAHLHAIARDYPATPDIELALNVRGAASHYPWQWLGVAQPSAGSVVLAMKIKGQRLPFQELRHHGLHDLSWLRHSTLTGQAQLEVQTLSYPQKVTGLTSQLKLEVALAQGSGRLNLHTDANRLAAGSLVAHRASAVLPLQIRLDHDNWRIGLQRAGQVKLDKIAATDAVHLQDPLSLSIPQLEIELVKKPHGMALKHRLTATATTFTLLAEQDKAQAIEAQIHPGKIVLSGQLETGKPSQGQLAISGMRLTLAQSQIQLNNIAATFPLGVTGTDKIADFTISQLQHLAATPHFAPISISGSIRNKSAQGQAGVYSLRAVGGIPGTRYLTLTGEQAPASGDGMATITITPLTFSAGGLQPQALAPALGELEDVSGTVSASAQFKWSQNSIHSSGVLDLDNVSFVHQAASISNLNAILNLTDLLSPRTPPQQTLTIRRIDPGIPMESLALSYQIGGSPPRLAIDKATLFLLGGIVSLGPTVIDPTSARNDVVIGVDNLDLAALFDQIQVQGLTGSGRLAGNIPITFAGNQIIIQNSHLAAQTPGTLQFHSEKAAQLLAGAGKEMDLLLQALQDFHYTELSLQLDKSATHDLIATLSLLGNNPNVKQGQMFRLNLNLESNIGQILQAIGQGYRLSNEVLRELFRLR